MNLLSFLAFMLFLWHAHWMPKESQSWTAWRWREALCVSWRGGRCPTLHPHGSLISPNNSSKIITRGFAWLERGSRGGRAGDGNHLNLEAQGSLQDLWNSGTFPFGECSDTSDRKAQLCLLQEGLCAQLFFAQVIMERSRITPDVGGRQLLRGGV